MYQALSQVFYMCNSLNLFSKYMLHILVLCVFYNWENQDSDKIIGSR